MDCYNISVIVPCHNYGRYLAECLTSIIEQSVKPAEILVVDDGSTDNTREVALRFADKGVHYIRAEHHDPLASRRLGARLTSGNILCFIDADDFIDPTYLESGIQHFLSEDTVGLVYSDVEYFGWLTGRENRPPSTESSDLHLANFIHAGALVRRDALEVTDAFAREGVSHAHEDWSAWRKIIDAGFIGVRQSSTYFYRQHAHNLSRTRIHGESGYDYFTAADLGREEITLFTPLSGRLDAWEQFRAFLEEQSWSHARTRLVLFDCSGSSTFATTVRQWLAGCDYPWAQCISHPAFTGGWTPAGPLWQSARRTLRDRWQQNSKILTALRGLLTTHYLWVVEEEFRPPRDACERLLRSFDYNTVSVTAACPLTAGAMAAWRSADRYLTTDEGVDTIAGNSFSCAIIRSNLLRNALSFDLNHDRPVETRIYERLLPHQIARINWGVQCSRPLPISALPGDSPITPDTFDEAFYLGCHPDVASAVYRGDFTSGYAHYLAHGASEGRVARAK